MGKLLDWDNMPPVGTPVVFKGYRTGIHAHWGFEAGKRYVIGKDKDGDIGPINVIGVAPSYNYNNDFIFELAEFTKSDLKDGMRVEIRHQGTYYVCGDWLIQKDKWRDFCELSAYSESLEWKFEDCDDSIIRVTDRDGTVLFEREEEPRELTIEEIAKAFNLPVERVRIKK